MDGGGGRGREQVSASGIGLLGCTADGIIIVTALVFTTCTI